MLTILTIIILVDPNLHPKRNHVWADWGGLSFSTSAKNFDWDLHASSFAIKIDIGNEIQISEAPQEYAFVRYLSILLCFSKYQYDYLKSYECARDIVNSRKIPPLIEI